MITVAGVADQDVAVLGLGRSGLSAARALRAGGATALCWDDNPAARDAAEAEGFACRDLHGPGAFDDVAALIVSPGIAHLYPAPNPVVAAALRAGVPVDNDIGLFFRSFATLGLGKFRQHAACDRHHRIKRQIHHLGPDPPYPDRRAGRRSWRAISSAACWISIRGDGEVVVLELSSYQTDLARALTPDIAVFTNLSPDHQDRHGGIGGYFAAKRACLPKAARTAR